MSDKIIWLNIFVVIATVLGCYFIGWYMLFLLLVMYGEE